MRTWRERVDRAKALLSAPPDPDTLDGLTSDFRRLFSKEWIQAERELEREAHDLATRIPKKPG